MQIVPFNWYTACDKGPQKLNFHGIKAQISKVMIFHRE